MASSISWPNFPAEPLSQGRIERQNLSGKKRGCGGFEDHQSESGESYRYASPIFPTGELFQSLENQLDIDSASTDSTVKPRMSQ